MTEDTAGTSKLSDWLFVVRATFLGACVVFSGCGTTPTPIAEAQVVPKERIVNPLIVSSEVPARLSVVRDRAGQPFEHPVELWVNGIEVVRLNAGEIFQTSIDPGPVILEVRMFNFSERIFPAQVETTLSPGKYYVYRAGLDTALRMHLIRDVDLSK